MPEYGLGEVVAHAVGGRLVDVSVFADDEGFRSGQHTADKASAAMVSETAEAFTEIRLVVFRDHERDFGGGAGGDEAWGHRFAGDGAGRGTARATAQFGELFAPVFSDLGS